MMQLVDKPRRAPRILAALFSAVLAAGALVSAAPTLAAETVGGGTVLENASKTATELDGNLESKVTLSFPGKQQTASSDVVFVIDKSGASAQEEIKAQAKQFLGEIKEAAESKGLNVKVGVVVFNYQGNIELPLTDVVSGYDDITKALDVDLHMGTNMHAGLLAAKEVLDADESVAAQNKHVILISDGATYLYCKDGDYKTAYTRSFGDPTKQVNPESGKSYTGRNMMGGIWEYQTREYNLNNAWKKFDDGTNFIFSQAMTSYTKLGQYLDYHKDKDAARGDVKYDYIYDEDSRDSGVADGNELPIEQDSAANIDVAFWSADEVFQQMANSGYDMNVYYRNNADFDGTVFLQYLARNTNNGELNTDFEELKAQITDMVSVGSYLEDYIGEDFDFVNDIDKISFSVNGEELTKVKVGATGDNTACYMFGMEEGSQRFDLTYDPDEDKLTLRVYESIAPAQPVTLTYHVALVNKPTEAGTYELATNKSATLYPVASDGTKGPEVTFDVPYVTYAVPDESPVPLPDSTPTNGSNQAAAAEDVKSQAPKTGDATSAALLAVVTIAGIAGASACAAARSLKRRR